MKKSFLICKLLLLFVCLNQTIFCQINLTTNESYNYFKKLDFSTYLYKPVLKSISNIECDKNRFWARGSFNKLYQFSINDSIVSLDGIIDTLIPYLSLAVCNNLNGGLVSPTFYTSNYTGFIYYYNGNSNWQLIPGASSYHLPNSAGNGNYLYFQNNVNQYINQIIRYNGVTFSIIYTCDATTIFTVADIAVDDNGNVWSFTGDIDSTYSCKHIDVISPTGQLIKRYNSNLNTQHGYGCFLLNNILYLGLGTNNPIYPNTLLPITFLLDSAYIGTPLSFPDAGFSDLASCNSKLPLFTENLKSNLYFLLYPNPATTSITIEFQKITNRQKYEIFICNLNGQLQYQSLLLQEKTYIDISNFSKGIYIIKIKNNDFIEVIRFVKI